MAKHCAMKYLMVLSRNDMFVFNNMFKPVMMKPESKPIADSKRKQDHRTES